MHTGILIRLCVTASKGSKNYLALPHKCKTLQCATVLSVVGCELLLLQSSKKVKPHKTRSSLVLNGITIRLELKIIDPECYKGINDVAEVLSHPQV